MLVFLVGILAISGCTSEQTSPVTTTPETVAANIDQYRDSLVTVSGEVDEIYTSRVFTIGGAGFQDDLLVISADPLRVADRRTADRPVKEQDVIQVTGFAHEFDAEELEQSYDVEIGNSITKRFDGEPVILAASGSSVLSNVVVTPRTGPSRTVPMDANPVTRLQALTAADDPARYTGRMAVFTDVEIRARIDTNAFWIGSSGDDRLFVTLPDAAVEEVPTVGERRTVYGIVREVPSETELLAEWGVAEETAQALLNDRVYLYGVQGRRTP